MPSWPSPTRTPASRSASSGSGSRLPGATVATAMSCVGEQLDQRRLTARVHRAEREGVADRHPTLHPERSRAFGDQLERERAELSGLVEVDVDADSVPFGDAEHDVEMGDRITVEGARIEPADEVGACPHGGVEQVGGARVANDAGLRERDHLHVGPRGVRRRPRALPPAARGPTSVSTWTWLRTVRRRRWSPTSVQLVATRDASSRAPVRRSFRSARQGPARRCAGGTASRGGSSRDGRGHRRTPARGCRRRRRPPRPSPGRPGARPHR